MSLRTCFATAAHRAADRRLQHQHGTSAGHATAARAGHSQRQQASRHHHGAGERHRSGRGYRHSDQGSGERCTGCHTRVQLIANDRIVRTVSSESSSGLRTMEVTLDYRPVVTGTLNLEVVAWRGSVPGDPASVSVTVRANRSQVLSTSVARPEVPVIDPNDPTCRVLTNVALNVRVNAGTGFDRITTLPDGRQAPVIGRLADNSWWQVSLRDGTAGWVAQHDPGNPAEQFISIYGDCTLYSRAGAATTHRNFR